ncbi:MAG: ABC transporter permease subunit [Actinophytocola sp.]|uniref:ABC transporter permease n=1 Tax=Actinophytocola sp. TaxID=1872138 RepID=UPI00132420CE|nr:ABC transporter permease subunit [Actinophytocola sp.]MPZ80076.1 ABC transporter permease subunit [Actinophytocola sp.]
MNTIAETRPQAISSRRRPRTRRKGRARALLLLQHILLIGGLLALWQVLVTTEVLPLIAVGSPESVWNAAKEILPAIEVWTATAQTAGSLLLGVLIGGTSGMLLGVFLHRLPRVKQLVNGVVVPLYTIPRAALVPLFIAWFGFGRISVVIVAAIHGFALVYVAIGGALASVDKSLAASVRTMGGGVVAVGFYVYFWSAISQVVVGFRQSINLGLMSVIVAEMIGASGGLGALLVFSINRFNVSDAMVYLLVAASLAVAMDTIVVFLQSRIVKW